MYTIFMKRPIEVALNPDAIKYRSFFREVLTCCQIDGEVTRAIEEGSSKIVTIRRYGNFLSVTLFDEAHKIGSIAFQIENYSTGLKFDIISPGFLSYPASEVAINSTNQLFSGIDSGAFVNGLFQTMSDLTYSDIEHVITDTTSLTQPVIENLRNIYGYTDDVYGNLVCTYKPRQEQDVTSNDWFAYSNLLN